ncbi:DUF4919 domain-containing protein [Luteolibacter ambystomatis]|uniref:DUF4919 domain-containing protein n=1 Tax=Luteolibacter ambystomatis TaxID=2824561 RepID=A0A975IY83_9BACT|nr:DUF4919 domain-containing protein [Luteolibacter ambystomatis]QUE49618.1 DUF4919 domain-containing protein [Luteolibacter ambystomatis]
MKSCLLLPFLLVGALAAEPDAPAKPSASVEKVELPSADVSYFTKLRLDYAKRPDFAGDWTTDEKRDALFDAFKEGGYQRAFELSGKWLEGCPVDAEAHMLRAAAARRLGDLKSYMYHSYFSTGLMQSVIASGDGKTAKTGFKVIAVAEEYAILRDFGAELSSQSLVDGPCDKMVCKMPGGKEGTIYFNVALAMEAGRRGLEKK